MGTTEPELVSRLFEACLAANDLDALRDLYEEDAVFADHFGAVSGWSEIKAAQQRLLDAGFALSLRDSVVFKIDDIALVNWSWTATSPDGGSVDGISAEVLRRQTDGSWKFIIDNSDVSALLGS